MTLLRKCLDVLHRAGHGAAGLAKAGVGADAADEQTVAERRRACSRCPHATGLKKTAMGGMTVLSPTSRCRVCKCLIAAKVRLDEQTCPIGQW